MDNESQANKTALVVVISGPSGVGKDVMIDRMIEGDQSGFHFTVTATTRDPRPGEQDGVNHHFLSGDEFINMIASNELLEWAQVYDNYYGVPKKQVRDALADGCHVIMRVDVQGARRLRELIPEALLIFIIPPSLGVLRKHLEKRGVNSEVEMKTRLSAAEEEIGSSDFFDYTVMNEEDFLDETVAKVVDIIETEATSFPPRRVAIE